MRRQYYICSSTVSGELVMQIQIDTVMEGGRMLAANRRDNGVLLLLVIDLGLRLASLLLRPQLFRG